MSDTVNTNINGVAITMSPAVPITWGPSGQRAQFQSHPGSSASTPIIVNFSIPVNSFSIDVVGPSYPGGSVIAYDINGNEIARKPVAQVFNPQGIDGFTSIAITAPEGTGISRVSLVPAPLDYVAYNNISIGSTVQLPPYSPPAIPPEYQPTPTAPLPTQPNSPSAPLPPLPPLPPALRLEDIVQISQLTTDRFYVKDSMQPIPSETFIVKNVSYEYDVWIEIAEVRGIVPSPRSFLLARNSSKEVQVRFDVDVMNAYPEGVSRITLPIRLTSKVIIVAPEYKVPSTQSPVVAEVLPPPPNRTAQIPPTSIAVPQPSAPSQIPTNNSVSYTPPPIIKTVESTLAPTTIPVSPPPRLSPTEPQNVWVSGYEGGIRYGQPPEGWVQDPYGATWYRPDDPFVLSGFGRNTTPTPSSEWIPINNTIPVLTQEVVPSGVWVSAYSSGLNYGVPPQGWVQDPYGGTWYRPDDPFVLSGWGKGGELNIPIEEMQPPNTLTPINGTTVEQSSFVSTGPFTPQLDIIQAI